MSGMREGAPGSAGQNGAHTEGVRWALMGDNLVVHPDGPITLSIATIHRAEYVPLLVAAPELYEALRGLISAVERLDIREGVCCCGDDMERHADPMSCGHSPVDAGEYYHGARIASARAALAKAEGRS